VRGPLEVVHIDPHVESREQRDHLAAERHGVGTTDRPAGEMRGLVEPGRPFLHAEVRPEQVHHLLAMELAAPSQRQQLDQAGSVPPGPPVVRHRPAVEQDLERSQQPDLDAHGTSLTGGQVRT
jgi:hypothetical protein